MTISGDQSARTAETIDRLSGYFRFTDAKLAELTGRSRESVRLRRTSQIAITLDDLVAFAAAFNVPPHVLLLDAPTAMRYVLDNDITLDGVERNFYNRRLRTI